MNLKNEMPVTWSSATRFAWSVFWRLSIISIPYGMIINFIWIPQSSGEMALYYLMETMIYFFILIVAIYWVLNKGYSNKRVVLFDNSNSVIEYR